MKCEDLSGKKFGRFTVMDRVGSDKWGRATWMCRCNCGTQKVVASHNLKSGMIASCGCLRQYGRR